MAETRTTAGTLIRHPEDVVIRDRGVDLIGLRGTIRAAQPEADAVLELLKPAGLETDDAIELDAPPVATGLRSGRRSNEIELEVQAIPGGSAVLLIEHDGVYEWRYPEPGAGPAGLRAGLVLRFRLNRPEDEDPGAPAPETRGPVLDAAVGWVFGKVRTYVLRFVAGYTVDALVSLIERQDVYGLVPIADNESANWLARPFHENLGPPKNILLLVHGTFFSTRGSFGGLALSPEGRGFLAAARGKYDLILGFDHKTLAETPEQNAEALLAALKDLEAETGAHLDAVAFSRGGLVLRWLTERLLPREGWPFVPGRLIFVGCTNGGTGLAGPKNWRHLVDFYTNIALAGTRALGLVPGVGSFSAILGQTIESLGRFAQYMAEAAIADGRVPGLAAMEPDSVFVKALNEAVPAEGSAPLYHAITGDFDPSDLAAGFTFALRDFFLNRITDRLFGGKNDLVVDTAAMTMFGRHQKRLDETGVVSSPGNVYHTIYFVGPDLPGSLGRWLFGDPSLPGRFLSDVAVLDADTPLHDAFEQLVQDYHIPVVIWRRHGDEALFYLRHVDDILRLSIPEVGRRLSIPEGRVTLREALNLHEYDAVPPQSMHPGIRSGGETFRIAHRVDLTSQPMAEAQIVLGAAGVAGVMLAHEGPSQWRPQLLAGPPDTGAEAEEWRVRGPAGNPITSYPSVDEQEQQQQQEKPPASGLPEWGEIPGPAATFTLHVDAEMPSRPPLRQAVELTVRLSRELPEVEQTPTHRVGSAAAVEEEPIRVRARPIRNCSVEAPDSIIVPPPAPQRPNAITFNIRGLAEGEAELWVEAWQDDRKLVTLLLAPVFVATSARLAASAQVQSGEQEGALIDLRIRDVTARDDQPVRLEYDMNSEDLHLLVQDESAEHKDKTRLDFIRSIYQDVENFWRQASGGRAEQAPEFVSGFLEELRDAGAVLADKIVPERIRRELWQAWLTRRVGAVRVLTREPSIPWELLYLRDPERKQKIEEGCFFAELGLVRWNAALGFPPALVQVRPDRTFYLIPDYPEKWRLKSAARDKDLVTQLFRAQPVEATRRGLRNLLQSDDGFDLFHAAAHGEAVKDQPWNSGLLLTEQDPTGRLYVFRATNVEAAGRAGSRPLIFLNACQVGRPEEGLVGAGGLAQAFLLEAHAGLLVAPMWSVRDETASIFAQVFYTRLTAGDGLARATRKAREEAKAANEPSWLAYMVYGHPFGRLELKAREEMAAE